MESNVFVLIIMISHKEVYIVDCPLSKRNQAPQPKFERPNGKILKSYFFYLVQELVRPAHLKAQ